SISKARSGLPIVDRFARVFRGLVQVVSWHWPGSRCCGQCFHVATCPLTARASYTKQTTSDKVGNRLRRALRAGLCRAPKASGPSGYAHGCMATSHLIVGCKEVSGFAPSIL